MRSSSKNSRIEFWRFCFAIGIAIMHFGYYNGFYIAVDFFFMLSGFLLMKSMARHPDWSVWKIFKGRLAGLYPHYLLSFLLGFLLQLPQNAASGAVLQANFWADTLLEGLCLQILYPLSHVVNGVTWYISTLVLWIPLLAWLIKYHKNALLHLLAPYGTLGIYAFFLSRWGHIDFGFVWLEALNGGLLRGLAGMLAGCIVKTVEKRYGNE